MFANEFKDIVPLLLNKTNGKYYAEKTPSEVKYVQLVNLTLEKDLFYHAYLKENCPRLEIERQLLNISEKVEKVDKFI